MYHCNFKKHIFLLKRQYSLQIDQTAAEPRCRTDVPSSNLKTAVHSVRMHRRIVIQWDQKSIVQHEHKNKANPLHRLKQCWTDFILTRSWRWRLFRLKKNEQLMLFIAWRRADRCDIRDYFREQGIAGPAVPKYIQTVENMHLNWTGKTGYLKVKSDAPAVAAAGS